MSNRNGSCYEDGYNFLEVDELDESDSVDESDDAVEESDGPFELESEESSSLTRILLVSIVIVSVVYRSKSCERNSLSN